MRKSKEELKSLERVCENNLRVATQALAECEAQINYNACRRKLRKCRSQLNNYDAPRLNDRLRVLEEYRFKLVRERAMIEDSWTATRNSTILAINRLIGKTDQQITEQKKYLAECE